MSLVNSQALYSVRTLVDAVALLSVPVLSNAINYVRKEVGRYDKYL
jgi:hypothetical protein